MSKFYTVPVANHGDVQTVAAVAHCPRCGGEEIYLYDEVANISGKLVHAECMTAEELEDIPTHPAGSFFEEAC